MWAFSPEKKAWRPIKTGPPRPRPIFGGLLEYIPALKGTVWHANNWQLRATWGLARHCRESTEISDSATLSQLPWTGV